MCGWEKKGGGVLWVRVKKNSKKLDSPSLSKKTNFYLSVLNEIHVNSHSSKMH